MQSKKSLLHELSRLPKLMKEYSKQDLFSVGILEEMLTIREEQSTLLWILSDDK